MRKGVLACHGFFGRTTLALALLASAPVWAQAVKPVMGKYGCTASSYKGGYVQYTPRGSFTLTADGKYRYNGFEKPSPGSYTVDDKGDLHFKDGYLNGGRATKIDRPNKFFLTFPNNPDNRWTCGLTDGK